VLPRRKKLTTIHLQVANPELKILEKWKELINQGIDQAQNFQDLKTLYENIPEDDT
jgi:hypothetical protein